MNLLNFLLICNLYFHSFAIVSKIWINLNGKEAERKRKKVIKSNSIETFQCTIEANLFNVQPKKKSCKKKTTKQRKKGRVFIDENVEKKETVSFDSPAISLANEYTWTEIDTNYTKINYFARFCVIQLTIWSYFFSYSPHRSRPSTKQNHKIDDALSKIDFS